VKSNRFNARHLMDEISQIVGVKGGGRADLAQAGGGDPHKLDDALRRFRELFI
jgi:alanyl-tRNA synthetase